MRSCLNRGTVALFLGPVVLLHAGVLRGGETPRRLLSAGAACALALLEGHDYRPEPDLARELDRAWTRAQEKFG